jgi:hypothetical protein
MQIGIPYSRLACQVAVKGNYDIVVASAGGFPKDINLYQSQKALTHAAMITRTGVAGLYWQRNAGKAAVAGHVKSFLSDIVTSP